MGAVTGFLGLGGGANGTGFGGPSPYVADPTGNANLQSTYQALQGIANGSGPNPAQAQYFQNTQDLAKQQAGAIGSVQGISPALAARMISQQGSGAMQNAAAAGASNLAAQQLGAYGAMGNIANSQAQIAAGLQANVNNNNTSLANTTMGAQQGMIGGLLNGAAGAGAFGSGAQKTAMAGAMFAKGGEVPQMSAVAQFMNRVNNLNAPAPGAAPGLGFKRGGAVPGKAKVAGNSYRNDTVPAMLSPGEVVVPRSVMNSKNAPEAAKRFVAAVMAKKGKR